MISGSDLLWMGHVFSVLMDVMADELRTDLIIR
jgi:hypothetical protein